MATTHNGQLTTNLVDPTGSGNVVGTYNGSGNLIANYTYGLGLVSQVAAGSKNYYDFDALGSTAGLTGPTGTILNTYSYLPFGGTLATTGTAANPFTFVGQLGVSQNGSGLINMRARLYDASAGRFISTDPLGFSQQSPNLYAYARNCPASLVDPTGLAPLTQHDVLVELVAQAIRRRYGKAAATEFLEVVAPYLFNDGNLLTFARAGTMGDLFAGVATEAGVCLNLGAVLALGSAAFAGWEIGTFINDVFLSPHAPADPRLNFGLNFHNPFEGEACAAEFTPVQPNPQAANSLIKYDSSGHILAPTFTLSGPTSGTYKPGDTVQIQWTAANVGTGSVVALCYDKGTSFRNATWITTAWPPPTVTSFTVGTPPASPPAPTYIGRLSSTPAASRTTRTVPVDRSPFRPSRPSR